MVFEIPLKIQVVKQIHHGDVWPTKPLELKKFLLEDLKNVGVMILSGNLDGDESILRSMGNPKVIDLFEWGN